MLIAHFHSYSGPTKLISFYPRFSFFLSYFASSDSSIFKFSLIKITRCRFHLLAYEVLFKQVLNCCADFICWLKKFCWSRPLTAVRLDPAISLVLIAPSPRYSGPTNLISFYQRFSIFLLFLRLLTPPFSSFLYQDHEMQILSAGSRSFV